MRPFQKENCYGSFEIMYTLHKKVFSKAAVKCFFFIAEINQILLFSGMQFLERSKVTVVKRHFLKKSLLWKFYVFAYLTSKSIFKSASETFFTLWFKLLGFSSYQEWPFCRDQK